VNANSVNDSDTKVWKRSLELAIYAVLSTVLVGHVLFISGEMEPHNELLVLAGALFGFTATFQLTPIWDFFANSESRISEHILSIVWEDDEQESALHDAKHAA